MPASCTLTFSVNSDLAGYAEGEHGLRRVSPAVLTTKASDWHHYYHNHPARFPA